MQTKTRHAMQRETLWEYVREVWQASAILIQQEGQKLNPQQRDSAKTIHNGITRLRQALREADHDAKSQPARHPTCGSDWNHALLSPLTSVRGFSKLLLDGAFGQLTRHQSQLVATIHRKTQPLPDLIGQLYLETDPPPRQPIAK